MIWKIIKDKNLRKYFSLPLWCEEKYYFFPLGNRNCNDVSGAIKVRIPQELDVVAFWPWNLDVMFFWSWNLDVLAFCLLKKRLGITMSWLICLRFLMSWFFGVGISMLWLFGLWISMSWFFSLGILMSWFLGLGISMLWYMCLHGLIFVFTKSIMPHN